LALTAMLHKSYLSLFTTALSPYWAKTNF